MGKIYCITGSAKMTNRTVACTRVSKLTYGVRIVLLAALTSDSNDFSWDDGHKKAIQLKALQCSTFWSTIKIHLNESKRNYQSIVTGNSPMNCNSSLDWSST
jgi:hypothetical protein